MLCVRDSSKFQGPAIDVILATTPACQRDATPPGARRAARPYQEAVFGAEVERQAMPFASTSVEHRTISSILEVLALSWYTNVVHAVSLAWRYAGLAWHRQPDWSESGADQRH
jgi:hypothetical protein